MKKTQIAAALVLASALPVAAWAQTNVTLYGIADVGLSHVDAGGSSASNLRVDASVQSGNRWGLRGSEDLGGGMKANFNVENGFAIDTGAASSSTVLFNRTAWAGITSGPVELRLGRQYSPYYTALANDPQGLGFWAPVSGITNYSYDRIDNSVGLSVNGGGVTGRLVWGAGAENLNANKQAGRYTGVGVEYKGNGLIVGGVYQTAKDATTGGTKATETLLHAIYNGKGWSLNGGLGENKSFTNVKTKSNWLGVTVDVGASGQILAHVGQNDPDGAAKSSLFSAAYSHKLSPRTNVYVSYGQVSNNATATLGLKAAGATSLTAAAGADPRALSLGVRHTF